MNVFLAVLVVFWAAMALLIGVSIYRQILKTPDLDLGMPERVVWSTVGGIFWPMVLVLGLAQGLTK